MNETKLDELIALAKSSAELQASIAQAVEALKDPANTGTATAEEIETASVALEAFNEAHVALKEAVAALKV